MLSRLTVLPNTGKPRCQPFDEPLPALSTPTPSDPDPIKSLWLNLMFNDHCVSCSVHLKSNIEYGSTKLSF